MKSYSVAIRTLGLSPTTLHKVLESVFSQTIRPEKVVIYIANGYDEPSWRVGTEEYVYVPKGMMSQRTLPYHEISSDYILMLDDDLELSPNTVQHMMATAETQNTDLLGADPFANHKLPVSSRIMAAITSCVYPHYSDKIAFQLRANGAFSYISSPKKTYYPSDTCSGPVMLWKAESFRLLETKAENWMDALGFAYGEDALLSYKAKANGMTVGIDFGAEVNNLDSRTTSNSYRRDPNRFYTRAKAMYATWWRMCYKPYGEDKPGNVKALIAGSLKFLWLVPVMAGVSAYSLSFRPIMAYLRGLRDGHKLVVNLPPYIIKQ